MGRQVGGTAQRGLVAWAAEEQASKARGEVSPHTSPTHLSHRPSSFWNCERMESTSAPTRPIGCRSCSGAAAAAAAGGWAAVRHCCCCCRRFVRPMAGSVARPASLLRPTLLLLPLLLLPVVCPAKCERARGCEHKHKPLAAAAAAATAAAFWHHPGGYRSLQACKPSVRIVCETRPSPGLCGRSAETPHFAGSGPRRVAAGLRVCKIDIYGWSEAGTPSRQKPPLGAKCAALHAAPAPWNAAQQRAGLQPSAYNRRTARHGGAAANALATLDGNSLTASDRLEVGSKLCTANAISRCRAARQRCSKRGSPARPQQPVEQGRAFCSPAVLITPTHFVKITRALKRYCFCFETWAGERSQVYSGQRVIWEAFETQRSSTAPIVGRPAGAGQRRRSSGGGGQHAVGGGPTPLVST